MTRMYLILRFISFQKVENKFTSELARFAVSNLYPGGAYMISVFAVNAKGRSEPVVLQASMLRLPEKQLTSEKGTIYFEEK